MKHLLSRLPIIASLRQQFPALIAPIFPSSFSCQFLSVSNKQEFVQEVLARISFNQTEVSHNFENFFMVAEQPEYVQFNCLLSAEIIFSNETTAANQVVCHRFFKSLLFLPDPSSRVLGPEAERLGLYASAHAFLCKSRLLRTR